MTCPSRIGAALSRHPVWTAIVLYAVLSVAMMAPGLLPGRTISTADSLSFAPPYAAERPPALLRPSNNELGDSVVQFEPFAAYTRQQLPDVPLWDPYLMGGRPFLADDQSAVFSPFSVPAYALGVLTSLAWSGALKLFVSALGTFLLARALALRLGGALLAGLTYGFSFWLITWLSYPHSGVWALLPWVLLATEMVVRRPDPASGALLALSVGLQFLCGHAESSFDTLVAVVAFLALRLIQRRGAPGAQPHIVGRSLLTFILGLAGGAALSALTLLPFVQLLLSSADIQQRSGTAVDQHLALRGLLGVFLPDYWGRATQTPLIAFIRAQAYYAGALPLLLAVAALVIRPRVERLWIALFGFTGLAIAVGIPPFLEVITRLPIFSSGHNSRLIPWYLIAVALLAGWGLDDLGARAMPVARRRGVLAAMAVVVAVPLVVVLARGEIHAFPAQSVLVATGLFTAPAAAVPGAANVIHLGSLLAWLAFAGAGVLLIGLRLWHRIAISSLVAAAILLVALDLFRAGMGYNPAVPQRAATQPTTGAIRYLEAHRGRRFQATADFSWNIIAHRYGLMEAGGYDVPIPERYDHLWRTQVDPEHPSQVGTTFSDIPLILPRVDAKRLHTLRLLGVTNLLVDANLRLALPGVHLAYRGRDARVYAVDASQPRVMVVGAQQTATSGRAAFAAVTQPSFDGRRVAVTEQAAPGVPSSRAASRTAPGSAQITAYSPEQVVVQAQTERRGLLVLDDSYAPGWTATIDGRSTPVREVDYVLRGVDLAAGRHTIVFRYRPWTWRFGEIISLAALLAILGALVAGTRRRRQPTGPGRRVSLSS